MHCTNSHGISVGSLGEYVGEVDIVGKSRSNPDINTVANKFRK